MAKVMSVAYESYEYGEYDDKDETRVNPQELRAWVEGIATLIVDEAHILGAQVIYEIATKLKAPNKYGFSASPWRDLFEEEANRAGPSRENARRVN